MRKLTEKIQSVSPRFRIGIVVDGGGGNSHAVRCARLGTALQSEAEVVYYPRSETCEKFLREETTGSEIRNAHSAIDCPVVITDLKDPRSFHAERIISIHDLGLSQCRSNVVIDGSIAQVFAYPKDRTRKYFLGPQYMMTREPVTRVELRPLVLVTLGGGTSASAASAIVDPLQQLGLEVVTAHGFSPAASANDEDLKRAMSRCAFAVSTAGACLYDLLASGIPTIAVAVNRLQLRTAMAFAEQAAVVCAGMTEKLSAEALLEHAAQILKQPSLAQQLAVRGQELLDGNGLSRVLAIVRGVGRSWRSAAAHPTRRTELWLNEQKATSTNC